MDGAKVDVETLQEANVLCEAAVILQTVHLVGADCHYAWF